MHLIITEDDQKVYLDETGVINFRHPLIQKKIAEFQHAGKTKSERAEMAFHFVRDSIQHSFDIESMEITITASETLEKSEGICFAKAHLLAALLRGMNIPAGFCYQRVTRKGTSESGYALHGLNALYLEDVDQWFRVDPRGNKAGVYSEFSISPEKLAYPIRSELDEFDYPYIYGHPLDSVIQSMKNSLDCRELFYKRPESI
ncbi:transglutaminase-like domain-containing protein [Cytobacillus massiliigabonensis]|uniref:transglutaminase-like domain-containing protein n=1 Tax=Cytobacillus massiliigabonensis TaxID=1871011 RepID=UPI000C858709|nr:transglutaminase family protein [Cytobacillus massiliigabonensis]